MRDAGDALIPIIASDCIMHAKCVSGEGGGG
jgi:hypothetical protein